MSASLIGRPLPHESARLHVSGRAHYVDDLPQAAGTLHAAPGLSTIARGRIRSMDLSAVRACPGVRAVLTAADIPGDNNCGPILHDDPILADGEIRFHGQPLFVVAAETRDIARQAAWLRGSRAGLYPGIGVSTARLDALGVTRQIAATRAAGTGGFVLFELNRREAEEILPALGGR